MAQYQVIVGNVGTIYNGDKDYEAYKHYNDAVARSANGVGKMAFEPVTLMKDGEILGETSAEPDTSSQPEGRKMRDGGIL